MKNLVTRAVLALAILGGLVLSACGSAAGGGPAENTANASMGRPAPPQEHAGKTNPFEGEEEAAAEGEVLFQANCASCHGPGGAGDGPAAAGLEPAPTNLAEIQGNLADNYLYWRIADGGLMQPFNSVMPAWRGILSEDQIWQLITFIRTLEG
jgi:mono/diheme cytochrome c family protein